MLKDNVQIRCISMPTAPRPNNKSSRLHEEIMDRVQGFGPEEKKRSSRRRDLSSGSILFKSNTEPRGDMGSFMGNPVGK